MEEVSLVCFAGIVEVMIQPTAVDSVTMVAGANGAVTQGTGLFDIGRTILGAVSAGFRALFKVGTDNSGIKAAARLKGSMPFDLFSNSSRVFGNGTGDSRFRQPFFNPLLDCFSFV